MDKAAMVELKKSFKTMSVVPNENDFVNAILSLKDHQRPAIVIKRTSFSTVRRCYLVKLKYARNCIRDKLSKVLQDFSIINEPVYVDFFEQYFDDLNVALHELKNANRLIRKISRTFTQQLENKDGCKSLDQCKCLKVNALGFLYTVAMRCLPSLAYLEQVRQHMAQATDIADTKHLSVFAKKDCTVPHDSVFEVEKAADFVHPDTLRWLEELEEKHGFRLHDDLLDCAKLSGKQEEHLVQDLSTSFCCLYPRL